jgi:TRAP-type C4-dicarboxylate transport system substrate-binding protein
MYLRPIAAALLVALARPAAASPGEPAPDSSERAAAGPVATLRMATIAPDGTGWARELRAFAREVEATTHGELHIKFYFGGVAGDDVQAAERIRRDQLDGLASGGILCERLSPTMRALRVLGLFHDRAEWEYTLARLKPQFDEEFERGGFVNLGEGGIGPHVLLTDAPVERLADLAHLRLWVWDLDDVMRLELPELGARTVALPMDAAAHAHDQRLTDGFVAPPTVALAWQWSTQARYVVDLPLDYISACLIVARRAFDPLPLPMRNALSTAAAKLRVRFEDLGRRQDQALLGGIFAHQGLRPLPASRALRAEYLAATASARERLGEKLVSRALLEKVNEAIREYRKGH